MCPLQITNDIEHLSSTIHGVNGTFIRHPSNVENYSNGHKLETGQPNQKKKIMHPSYILLHLSANFWLKIQKYKWAKVFVELFRHLDNWHLMAHQIAQWWYGQKSKIG